MASLASTRSSPSRWRVVAIGCTTHERVRLQATRDVSWSMLPRRSGAPWVDLLHRQSCDGSTGRRRAALTAVVGIACRGI
jgi:hypothetical protein